MLSNKIEQLKLLMEDKKSISENKRFNSFKRYNGRV